jgi:putative flippase GtrA
VVSTLVAFVAIVAIGYTLHCLFTFSEKLSLRGLVRYTAAMLLTLPFSLGGMFVMRDLVHIPMWIASPLLTGLLFCWNYVATHWAVVTRRLTGKKTASGEAAR